LLTNPVRHARVIDHYTYIVSLTSGTRIDILVPLDELDTFSNIITLRLFSGALTRGQKVEQHRTTLYLPVGRG